MPISTLLSATSAGIYLVMSDACRASEASGLKDGGSDLFTQLSCQTQAKVVQSRRRQTAAAGKINYHIKHFIKKINVKNNLINAIHSIDNDNSRNKMEILGNVPSTNVSTT